MVYILQLITSDPFTSDIVQMVSHAGPMVKFVLLLLFFFSLFLDHNLHEIKTA